MRDFLMLMAKGRVGKQATTSGVGSYAPKENHFYALQIREYELKQKLMFSDDDPDIVTVLTNSHYRPNFWRVPDFILGNGSSHALAYCWHSCPIKDEKQQNYLYLAIESIKLKKSNAQRPLQGFSRKPLKLAQQPHHNQEGVAPASLAYNKQLNLILSFLMQKFDWEIEAFDSNATAGTLNCKETAMKCPPTSSLYKSTPSSPTPLLSRTLIYDCPITIWQLGATKLGWIFITHVVDNVLHR
ncbi:hypothetical protein KY284_012331 [Solanum tuberosum]|nr:hypothetical protein KY284_012331 [Solanum tuberosum]